MDDFGGEGRLAPSIRTELQGFSSHGSQSDSIQDHASPACTLSVPGLWCHTCSSVCPEREDCSRRREREQAMWMFLRFVGETLPGGNLHIKIQSGTYTRNVQIRVLFLTHYQSHFFTISFLSLFTFHLYIFCFLLEVLLPFDFRFILFFG